jgi:phosphoenolpyruvate-protein kinase (PTS system EI component)
MKIIQGIPGAPGVAFGKVLWLGEENNQVVSLTTDPNIEKQRLDGARLIVRQSSQMQRSSMKDHPEEAAIFETHLMMLDDLDLLFG